MSLDFTRTKLIKSGKRVFSDKGYDQATVKDIAGDAKMNISLVSYHFGGKEGLYQSCLEEFGVSRFEVAKRILTEPRSVEDLHLILEMYLREILQTHIDQPESCKMIMMGIENRNPVALQIFENTFLKAVKVLIEFFRSAQKKKFLRDEVSPEELTTFLYGSVFHITSKDDLSKRYFGNSIRNESYRETVIKNLVNVFLNGAQL